MDANDRGGRTQIFQSKASKPETQKHKFYLPYMHLTLQLGWSHQNFIEIFYIIEL